MTVMAVMLSGCGKTYRYKMTVEVDTPQGLRTGSAVREITYSKSIIKLPDAPGASAEQHGEAVAVDLPGGQTLFVLCDENAHVTLQTGFGGDSQAVLDAAKSDRRVGIVAPFPSISGSTSPFLGKSRGYPHLVRFKNIADPMSLQTVDPRNLAASFGPQVKLKRITVEMTDDPVTTAIEKKIPKPNDKGFFGNPTVVNGRTVNIAIGAWLFRGGK